MSKATIAALEARLKKERKRQRLAQIEALRTITHVSRATFVSFDNILSKCRKRKYADARHLTWYIMFRKGHSAAKIAEVFSTDHKTVGHGIDKIYANRHREPFASKIERIKGYAKE